MTYSAEVLADAPLLYLRLEETGSPTAAADSSGNGRSAPYHIPTTVGDQHIVFGTAGLIPSDPTSKSITFSGNVVGATSANYIDIPHAAWMDVSAVTIECWIKTTATGFQMLWDRDPGSGARPWRYQLNNGKFEFVRIADATGALSVVTASSTITVNDGNAHHLVATYDGTTIKLYIDGALNKSVAASGGLCTTSTDNLRFGQSPGGGAVYQNGVADELAYYGTALSATRIAAHYNAASASPNATVTAVAATATASALAPSVTAVQPNATVAAPAATATASAPSPTVGAATAATVMAVPATATAAAIPPFVSDGSGSATVAPPPATATAGAPTPVPTLGFVADTVNRLNGRSRGGTALVTVEPAVAPPPATVTVNFGVDKALALPDPMLVDGRPTNPAYVTARATAKPGSRDRIIVGGVDITYFRGRTLTVPGYTLSEPLAYDASSLTIPQVRHSETLGTGELRWARKGAHVKFQRAFADGSVITDYRGRVLSLRITGDGLELGIGGQVSGPANLRNEQPPAYWHTHDVGWWAFDATRPFLHMTPRFGPDTGHRIPKTGGITTLAWIQQVCAESQEGNRQRSIMPKVWGSNEWAFDFKDTTTVDCTIFLDGARAVADLVDDVSEQPNTWFGTGTTPDGVRVRNIRWPGLMAGEPAPYPIAGGVTFGQGTKDSDTIDGSGITVMQIKLQWAGYIDQDDYVHGTFDAPTAGAVKRLQRDVNRPVTGMMDTKTWNRLFNVDATGWDLTAGRVFPLVQDPAVPSWDYTSNGSIAGANAQHVPGTLEVDRNVDFGGGVSKTRMIDWCEGQMERLSGKNWTGTITLNGSGAFAGTWQIGATPPASAVMSYRDIRPGMNVWLPDFDSGTLVHVGGASFDGDKSVTLYVDTLARDLMELSEVIKRNRESRRNIRREWRIDNRAGKPAHDLITYDEYGGVLDHDRHLTGGKWNVIPIPMGQTGSVGRTIINCTKPAAEFCFAVLSRDVSEARLRRRVGNPFPVDNSGQSVWETGRVLDWMDDKTILNAEGDELQPCGYGHRRKFGDKTDANGDPIRTDAPLVGRLVSDATFGYVTASNHKPVVWLAIWPDRDCMLQAGRIFYKLEDDAV